MSLQKLFVMFRFDQSWKTVVIHESKYMILRTFERLGVGIAHALVDFCSYFGVETYLRRERTKKPVK